MDSAASDYTTARFIPGNAPNIELDRDWSEHPAARAEVEALTSFIAKVRKIAFQLGVLQPEDSQCEADRDWEQQPATRHETEVLMRVVVAVRDIVLSPAEDSQ